jgi:hypothetical protein
VKYKSPNKLVWPVDGPIKALAVVLAIKIYLLLFDMSFRGALNELGQLLWRYFGEIIVAVVLFGFCAILYMAAERALRGILKTVLTFLPINNKFTVAWMKAQEDREKRETEEGERDLG